MEQSPEILYEDNHLLAVYKPGGTLVQGDRTGDITLLELGKTYIKKKYRKPGNVYLGLVHRLDRPVSGVVLFARTSKAASRLAREFRARQVKKTYLAVVFGRPSPRSGKLEAYVERAHLKSRIASAASPRARPAVLSYRVRATRSGLSLLELTPETGRHHQIRLQLADAGHSIVGDVKYGAPEMLPDRTIALHACELIVKHPTRDAEITLTARAPRAHPWKLFTGASEGRFR